MAGSAINLGGMLSQMGNSMGSMGESLGKGMFQPMIDRQVMEKKQEMILESEARAEQRSIEGEKRRSALATASQVAAEERREIAAEKARTDQLGRDQERTGAMQGPSIAAATAIDNNDPVALKAAIENMKDVGLQYPNSGASAEAVRLQGLVGDVQSKASMQELNKIDRVLNNKDSALPESERLAMQTRKDALLSDGEVNTAYNTYHAALDKQTDETINRKIELRAAQAKETELEKQTATNNYATAVIAGKGKIDSVPAEYKAGVTAAVKTHRENVAAIAKIQDHTQPLSKDIIDWAANDPDVSLIVSDLARDVQNGTAVSPINARKQIAAAYEETHSYARDQKRVADKNAAKLASVLRVEETLRHSETWGYGTDILEELQEVPAADRPDNPLWNMMSHIAETNPNLSGRKLAEKLVAAHGDENGKFNEKTIDINAHSAIVGASSQLPDVQAWKTKNPAMYNAMEKDIADAAKEFLQIKKAQDQGYLVGSAREDYSKPFAQSRVLRDILEEYKVDKVGKKADSGA